MQTIGNMLISLGLLVRFLFDVGRYLGRHLVAFIEATSGGYKTEAFLVGFGLALGLAFYLLPGYERGLFLVALAVVFLEGVLFGVKYSVVIGRVIPSSSPATSPAAPASAKS